MWKSAADMPEPMVEAGAAVHKGRIYVVGGRIGATNDASARAYRYDPATNRWERLPDLPSQLWKPGVAVVGDTLLVIGGNLKTDAFAPTSDVWAWSEATRSWVHHTRLPIPSTSPIAAGSSTGVLAASLGGLSVPPGDSTAFLDRSSLKWRYSAPAPVAVERLLSSDAEIWALGSNRVARFQASSRTWTGSEGLPSVGFVLGSWLRNDRVHVVLRLGGAVDHFVREGASNWTLRTPPPAAANRSSALTVAVGGRLYLIGGSDNTLGPLTRVDVYEES